MAEPALLKPVLLKKYSNRRLYDTQRSSYVTLAEVEEMLQQGQDIVVRDAKTEADLTRSVLVQILAERPASRDLLPLPFLKQVIRSSASPDRRQFQRVLDDWVSAFSSAQRGVLDQMAQLASTVASASQDLRPWPPTKGKAAPAATAPTPAEVVARKAAETEAPPASAGSEVRGELDALKAELGETQRMLRQLLQAQQDASAAADADDSPGATGAG